VTDTAGNAATPITRNVNVLNGDLPIITLSGSATVLHEQGVTYVDQGATGNDVQDGPVISTANIIASGTVLWGTGGTYTIDYNLTDSNSNPAVTVTRTVIVADRTAPVITMSGSNTVSITKDGTYIDAGATWTDLVDGSGAAIRNSNVNTSIVGTYTVTYDHIDAAGNTGATITRTVQVVTGGIPTITLNGSGTVNLLTGS
jgi:hypothetical protein